MKNLKFDFYISHISKFLKENPNGNYKNALNNGVNFIEVDLEQNKNLDTWIKEQNFKKDEILIEEGGRLKEASYGIKILIQEINSWAKTNNIKELNVFLPSGTGTTALFLQKYLDFKVFTTPCVGDAKYLKEQFFMLEKDEESHPIILESSKKYHFGKLYRENYEIYKELKEQTNIEFDLLYDPIGWNCLLNNIKNKKIDNKIVTIYIHQGGILGNITMLERYKRKYL